MEDRTITKLVPTLAACTSCTITFSIAEVLLASGDYEDGIKLFYTKRTQVLHEIVWINNDMSHWMKQFHKTLGFLIKHFFKRTRSALV